MPGRGHLGRVACPLNRDDRRATAALGDGCPTRSNLTARSVEEQLVGRSPEYRRGNPTENPVGKTEVVLQLAGPAGGRQKHSVVVSKTRGSSTVSSPSRPISVYVRERSVPGAGRAPSLPVIIPVWLSPLAKDPNDESRTNSAAGSGRSRTHIRAFVEIDQSRSMPKRLFT